MEPLKDCDDNGDDSVNYFGEARQKETDVDEESKMRKLRSSSFSDSLDDINSSEDHDEIAIRNYGLRRRPAQFGNDNGNNRDRVVTITRELRIPDNIRIQRSLRIPEFGPKILFFSGGTAIRDLSACLINYTHNSIHLITPFDSGGSSAKIP